MRPMPEGPRRIPIVRDALADLETPLSAYWKLAHDEPHSFLLESVTGGEQVARYSILGVRPSRVLRAKGGAGRWVEPDGSATEVDAGSDPLSMLRGAVPRIDPEENHDLPFFAGGAVGMIGYDYARFIERLPEQTADDLDLDDVAMMIQETVVVFDHAKNLVRVVVLAEPTPEGRARAEAEIDRVQARLAGPLPPLPLEIFPTHPVELNTTQSDYESAVARAIEYIAAGDCIQVVPSLRHGTRVDAHPMTVYRALRSLNPSPYMFLLRFGDFDIVGASPEVLVTLHGQTARVRPIAGTRKRGESHEADLELERELLADAKERAEHIMLVDLGRNDLGRVCEYGSVRVTELMVVERYSHVMHIVSDVEGTLAQGHDAVDVVRATFPAGTVSGAPKVRAMEIIEELEPTRRGLYAGAVGYFSAGGDMDLAIAIRTILLKGGHAYVQAGAGVVFDSVPSKEFEECQNKARASLRAIELAQGGLERHR